MGNCKNQSPKGMPKSEPHVPGAPGKNPNPNPLEIKDAKVSLNFFVPSPLFWLT